jgi:nuclear pore complex protein Nup93
MKIQSIEIQKRVGAFSMALDTINKCLSEALYALSHRRLDGESRTAGLIHSGNEILETYRYYPEVRLFQYSAFQHVLLLGFCS